RQINQYTRYLTVFLATLQGYFIAVSLQANSGGGLPIVAEPGPFFLITAVITLVGG
ncbi:MAG TPA: preprotein translocase subunit SecY, partial [Parvularcula sp.]|nr:preprotein translocase subunit SecY [Parvularcula sp.]